MTIAELIAEAKAMIIDEARLQALQLRIQEVETKLDTRARVAVANKDFMPRTCNL